MKSGGESGLRHGDVSPGGAIRGGLGKGSRGGAMGSGYLTGTGPDGKVGFGGKCLPKDARMLAKLLGSDCLLRRALAVNDRMR
jgi:UDP-glucose 6-dehydrogenase